MRELFLPQQDLLVCRREQAAQFSEADTQPHFHYQYELLLIGSGTGEFRIGRRVYQIQGGDILFISNLEDHVICWHSLDFDRHIIRFSGEVAAAWVRDPVLMSVFQLRPEEFSHRLSCGSQERRRYGLLAEQMRAEYDGRKPCWDRMVLIKLQTLLVELYRNHPQAFPADREAGRDELVFQVQSYLETHLAQDLRLETVAGMFYVSPHHLSHRFSRAMGYSYKQFILMARISKAKDLLMNTRMEVGQVGGACGFHSDSHFIRTFKAAEGVTPLRFRNR